MNYQVPQIEWQDQYKLDQNKVETGNWHRSFSETLIHAYQIMESMTEQNKVMVHYYNKQTRKGKPYISCPNFNDVSEAKEWVETTHYPSALIKAGFKPVSEPLADTLKWFELAVPEPTDKNKCVQLGCHYEKFAEMLIAVIGGEHLLSKQVKNAANAYKSCFRGQDTLVSLEMNNLAKNELLDSLCDQIVTALGVGYMFGFDMQKAFTEVVRSNFSKFENGKPVFDDNGKIKEGANYTPPQLQEFI